jgi:hypothetical protein
MVSRSKEVIKTWSGRFPKARKSPKPGQDGFPKQGSHQNLVRTISQSKEVTKTWSGRFPWSKETPFILALPFPLAGRPSQGACGVSPVMGNRLKELVVFSRPWDFTSRSLWYFPIHGK